jgi:hypothetical protein
MQHQLLLKVDANLNIFTGSANRQINIKLANHAPTLYPERSHVYKTALNAESKHVSL